MLNNTLQNSINYIIQYGNLNQSFRKELFDFFLNVIQSEFEDTFYFNFNKDKIKNNEDDTLIDDINFKDCFDFNFIQNEINYIINELINTYLIEIDIMDFFEDDYETDMKELYNLAQFEYDLYLEDIYNEFYNKYVYELTKQITGCPI